MHASCFLWNLYMLLQRSSPPSSVIPAAAAPGRFFLQNGLSQLSSRQASILDYFSDFSRVPIANTFTFSNVFSITDLSRFFLYYFFFISQEFWRTLVMLSWRESFRTRQVRNRQVIFCFLLTWIFGWLDFQELRVFWILCCGLYAWWFVCYHSNLFLNFSFIFYFFIFCRFFTNREPSTQDVTMATAALLASTHSRVFSLQTTRLFFFFFSCSKP